MGLCGSLAGGLVLGDLGGGKLFAHEAEGLADVAVCFEGGECLLERCGVFLHVNVESQTAPFARRLTQELVDIHVNSLVSSIQSADHYQLLRLFC